MTARQAVIVVSVSIGAALFLGPTALPSALACITVAIAWRLIRHLRGRS